MESPLNFLAMKSTDIGKQALSIHGKLRGKVEISLKSTVKNPSDLSILYSPGVGAVSSHLAKFPDQADRYTWRGNVVAVISDGSAVLGLGNIGPVAALPVMEGKALLFKRFAGIDAVPIVLGTQDTEEVVSTVARMAPSFGGINLEDIAAPRCFDIEARLRKMLDIPVFHDDQHGTALVVLAGLFNALRVVRKKIGAVRIVISGAGAAGHAIADLLGMSGARDIIMLDSRGILSRTRTDLDAYKVRLLDSTNQRNISGGIEAALPGADVFIGVSKGGIVSSRMIQSMADSPIVFALANPIPEIMPDEAKRAGAAIIATGRSDFPNQINNVLGFPGIFRGALDRGVRDITNEMLARAAGNLAKLVENPSPLSIIPSPFDTRVVPAIARAIR